METVTTTWLEFNEKGDIMVANFYWSIILKIIWSSEQGLTNGCNLVYTLVYTSKNLGICMCTNTLFVNGFPPTNFLLLFPHEKSHNWNIRYTNRTYLNRYFLNILFKYISEIYLWKVISWKFCIHLLFKEYFLNVPYIYSILNV